MSGLTKSPANLKARGVPGRRLLISYAVLATVAALFVIATELWPRGRFLDTYGPNLAAELIGILVTVLFVERLLAWQRDRQLAPLRVVALRRTSGHIHSLLSTLQTTYKAAAVAGSPEPYEPREVIKCWDKWGVVLDFNREAPVIPFRTWAVHAAEVFDTFERNLLADLDRYAEALGRDYVVAVEELLREPLFSIMKSGVVMTQIDASLGLRVPRTSLNVKDVVTGESTIRRQFGDKLLALIEVHEAIGGDHVRLVDGTWRDDSRPHWCEGQVQPADYPDLGTSAPLG